MIDSDLKRSYHQYKKRIKLGLIKVSFLQKLILGILFFIILFLSIMFSSLFLRKNSKKEKIFLIDYSDKEPHKSIKEELVKIENILLIKFDKYFLPILPIYFYKGLLDEPIFWLKNLDFLGALSIQVAKYYNLYHSKNMHSMIVLQEYSFYMSYLTSIIEFDGGKLYNIMHGIPGDEASFFRFSKCFVWGKYYEDFFIKNGAEKSQFIVSGSIFHNALLHKNDKLEKPIYDIVYMMQGKHANQDEIDDILEVLYDLSKHYNVAVRQHPIYKVSIMHDLKEIKSMDFDDILNSSKMIISHFSTSLLDAKVLSIPSVAYSKIDRNKMLAFMDKKEIANSKSELLILINYYMSPLNSVKDIDNNFIDFDIDTLRILTKEMNL